MSYVDTQTGAANRAKSVFLVGGIHVLIAAGLAAGLTISYTLPDEEAPFVARFIDEDVIPPKPPEQVEPKAEIPTYVPPATAKPKINLPPEPTITVKQVPREAPDTLVRYIPEPRVTPSPTATVRPAPPRFTPVAPAPRNGPSGWISNNDYPSTPLRRGQEGTARYRLIVGSDGRVDACEITASTGVNTLDRETCRLIERRARFDPAKDGSGETVVGSYAGSVTWQIPD